eukprot:TRINITY_DN2923_c0_g1_i1.p1 TRINITY_DN2923_c0_g1~~TRINITY_DN2923_c0_g1_i1.p1  ORF type:complete len:340 (-),score=13.86 TRINITY_DN2923_c0_g1_i1:305-1324(-)
MPSPYVGDAGAHVGTHTAMAAPAPIVHGMPTYVHPAQPAFHMTLPPLPTLELLWTQCAAVGFNVVFSAVWDSSQRAYSFTGYHVMPAPPHAPHPAEAAPPHEAPSLRPSFPGGDELGGPAGPLGEQAMTDVPVDHAHAYDPSVQMSQRLLALNNMLCALDATQASRSTPPPTTDDRHHSTTQWPDTSQATQAMHTGTGTPAREAACTPTQTATQEYQCTPTQTVEHSQEAANTTAQSEPCISPDLIFESDHELRPWSPSAGAYRDCLSGSSPSLVRARRLRCAVRGRRQRSKKDRVPHQGTADSRHQPVPCPGTHSRAAGPCTRDERAGCPGIRPAGTP